MRIIYNNNSKFVKLNCIIWKKYFKFLIKDKILDLFGISNNFHSIEKLTLLFGAHKPQEFRISCPIKTKSRPSRLKVTALFVLFFVQVFFASGLATQ
jgi:hypothetical protein